MTTTVDYDDPYVNGTYSPLLGVTVTVEGEITVSPAGGTVTFFGASGAFIYEAVVGTADSVECDGFPAAAPLALPMNGYYSGTSTGSNVGIGSVHAASSGQAY